MSRGVESIVSQTVALGSSKSRKTVSVQHSQSLRYQRTLFFQLINSCFSHYYVPTDGVAPFSVDMNHTRLIIFRSDILLILLMLALETLNGVFCHTCHASSVTNIVKHCISSQGIRVLIFYVIVGDCNCRARRLSRFTTKFYFE